MTPKTCARCRKDLNGGYIMSMMNTDIICLDCEKAEKEHPDYEKARAAEAAAVRSGNYNYQGLFAGRKI